jgi:acetoin utilization protein AcuC
LPIAGAFEGGTGSVVRVGGRSVVVWDDALAAYDFGPGHPLAPVRVQLAMRLARDLGLVDGPDVTVVRPQGPVTEAQLLRVHEATYVEAVSLGSSVGRDFLALDQGIGTDDCPSFAGMHEAAAAVCGATLTAARAVMSGQADHAVNLAGGLHHAMPDRAAGFCIYNDIGVAIQALLDDGVERIAYVDVDVHHGDGVQAMFWNDPRVMTISIHESPRSLWPGTGLSSEIGGPAAAGSKVNVPLPAGTGDEGWLMAFHAIVPDLLGAFRPDVLVSQHGCDSHADDPLAHMALSIDGQRMSYAALHRFAHQFAHGRWVALGGGGYELVDVVPRAWAHLIGEVVGAPVDPTTPVPQGYLEYVRSALGRVAPARMTDGRTPYVRGWEAYDPEDPVSQAIMATRDAVFPHWGLMADPYGSF